MATLTLRTTKDGGLTVAECDTNFTNLNTAKLEFPAVNPTIGNLAAFDGAGTLKDASYSIATLANSDNHIEGTTNKKLTAAEKVKLTTLRHLKIVQVNSAGAFTYNPYSGWTAARTALGTYRVTHNLNNWYHVDLVWCNDADGIAEQAFATNMYIDVRTYNFSGVLTDKSFSVFLFYPG